VGFEQATIKIEKEAEFEELKNAIGRAFAADRVQRLLNQVSKKGLRIRDWNSVLAKRVLEAVDQDLSRSGKKAQQLYEALTVPDQSQIREFYLFRVEEVDPRLRTKFHKIYQYY
jgi:transposase-like protein